MSDASQSNAPAIGGTINGDNLSIDDLREVSIAEYDREFGTQEQEAKPEKKTPPPSQAEEEEEPQEEESEEEESDEATDEEDSEEEESEEDEETGEEDLEEGKYIEVKAKNGRKIKISKDATFDVKIDGKVESLTAQEVVNRASGAVALDRKHTELGRERQRLQRERAEFEERASVTNANLKTLSNIAENGSPEDFAQYYGMLTGKDANQVLETMISNAIRYATEISQMTDRERMMYNENRKYKFQQELQKQQEALLQQKQTTEKERAEVEGLLKAEGLEVQDFLSAAEDVRQRIASGELRGKYSAKDIAMYAVALNHEKRVTQAISEVNKSLLANEEFVAKVSKAIAGAEKATGERFTPKEAKALVKTLTGATAKKASESLSKKVERAKKSGKTNSKIANSRNQENLGDEAITLKEHWDRLYGGN